MDRTIDRILQALVQFIDNTLCERVKGARTNYLFPLLISGATLCAIPNGILVNSRLDSRLNPGRNLCRYSHWC